MLLLLAHVVLHLRFCVTFLSFVFSFKDFFPLGFLGLVYLQLRQGTFSFMLAHPSSLSSCYVFAFPVQLKVFGFVFVLGLVFF